MRLEAVISIIVPVNVLTAGLLVMMPGKGTAVLIQRVPFVGSTDGAVFLLSATHYHLIE